MKRDRGLEMWLNSEEPDHSVPGTRVGQLTTTCASSSRGSNASSLHGHQHSCAHRLTHMYII